MSITATRFATKTRIWLLIAGLTGVADRHRRRRALRAAALAVVINLVG
jgi:hypothetical protein